MTNGSNVRVRSAPETTAPIVFELPLGAELLVLDRSNSADPWFHVRTDDGREGWVLGRLTIAIDAAHHDQTVESIVLAQLKNHSEITGTSFPARVQLFDLIDRTLRRLTEREAIARFALYRLRSMQDAFAGVPFGGDQRDPYQTWIAEHKEAARYNEPAGAWMVDPAYVMKVHEQYRDAMVADDIAWFHVRNGLFGECEGDVPCYVSSMNDLEGVYLRTHPRGRHADESTAEIAKGLNSILKDYVERAPGRLIEFNPATQCGELRASLEPLRVAVAQSSSARKDDALAPLDRIARLCQ
jgi:hypothetical protein